MSGAVLISANALYERRSAIEHSADLSQMRAHLSADVARVLAHPLHVPEKKALLSRWGAHCKDDGAELAFDPFAPNEQRCTKCGRMWSTEQSRRWWIYWYQLWLAERVLMMALESGEGGNAAAEGRALETLAGMAARYATWPNADNVLGPSRPFFSTYLESIWVLHLAAASDVLAELGRLPADLAADLREHLFRPSAVTIADFDEGTSNRQVWNSAALYALGRLLGDAAMAKAAVHGPSGIVSSITANISADGSWYEGENYHWFALRGLAWGAELLRTSGDMDLWTADERFRAAFRAPVLTTLPDFTFPARRDSKFGVSLRQRRMAELWELALARTGRPGDRGTEPTSEFYASLLAHVYDPSIVEGSENPGAITDVERSEPPAGVRRGALGWKALLWAVPELPHAEADAWRPGSMDLESTGLAIFRPDHDSYISLDYGQSGGGHGHPDRLNLTAVIGGVPWLLDFGTGSYVDPSLVWYRTTLAHNAPLVDGQSQFPADGTGLAFDEADGYGWACAYLPAGTAYDGVTLQRTVVVTPDYVLDVLQMQSDSGDHQLALPWHGLGQPRADEHGVVYTREDELALRVHLSARQPFTLLQQRGPGPAPRLPGDVAKDLDYVIVIANGEAATVAACLDAQGAVAEIECGEEDFVVRLRNGTSHLHRPTDDGWEVERGEGDPVRLGGLREPVEADAQTSADAQTGRRPDAQDDASPPMTQPLVIDREDQFRRAEMPYPGKAAFSATATVRAEDEDLQVAIDVVSPARNFRPPGADPEWENENPDIHSDGVQVYLETTGFFGWLLVPEPGNTPRLRVSAARGTDGQVDMIHDGAWEETVSGYRVSFRVTLPETPDNDVGFDVYVNLLAPGDDRRSGQLVWSGARGQRLYLAGDRAMPGALPRVKL